MNEFEFNLYGLVPVNKRKDNVVNCEEGECDNEAGNCGHLLVDNEFGIFL